MVAFKGWSFRPQGTSDFVFRYACHFLSKSSIDSHVVILVLYATETGNDESKNS